MAIDLCSEISSAGISPRISFSHDLKNVKDDDGDDPLEDNRRRRSDLCLLDSSSDFVFCISNNVLSQELSSADELFSNGKIVPTEIKRSKPPNVPSSCSSSYSEIHPFSESGVCPRSETSSTGITQKKKRLVEFLNEEEKPPTRSIWQFKRSSSLNYEATRGKSLIRSLQFLSRSKSTGSSMNPKQSEIPKETQKQRLQKQSSVPSRRPSSSSSSSSSFSSSSTFYFYSSSRNPQSLNKKCGSSSGNGVRISPVLNLPQAYIPKAYMGFFGFGSLFCNGKIKRKNK